MGLFYEFINQFLSIRTITSKLFITATTTMMMMMMMMMMIFQWHKLVDSS